MGDRHSLDSFAFPILIGDIGGTYARFALVQDAETVVTFPIVETSGYGTVEAAIEDTVLTGQAGPPQSAILAVAGPIADDRVKLTNCSWVVDPVAIMTRFGPAEVILLNDFEALSLSLPDLGANDSEAIGDGRAETRATRVVLGPGTGLGAGALVPVGDAWLPIAGEGGHIDLAPVSSRDHAIWPYLQRKHGRVSGETLLCGAGLVRLYDGICASDGSTPTLTSPADIVAMGLSGDDAQAVETLSLFATHLGRFAGNIALMFMARGGIYLAGGVSTRIAPVLREGGFRDAFLDKAPHRALMERMATAIITREGAALAGLGAFARRPARFRVDVSRRRWRR